jgi:hypothetical protein
MEVPAYHQLLAEQYEENAKNLLVYQREYEDEDGDVDRHTTKNYDVHELDEPELFNQAHGDRGTEQTVIPPKDFEDKTRNSIRYDKDVKTHIVDIDSRFRAYPKQNFPLLTSVLGVPNTNPPSNVANFVFALPKAIKNAITIQITSMCFPNVFYTFSLQRENISFTVYDQTAALVGTVVIKEGNYKAVADLVTEIQTKLTSIVLPGPINPFKIQHEPTTNKIRIYRDDGGLFGLDFTPLTIREAFNNGMGYNLGYEQFRYGTVPLVAGQPSIALTQDTVSSNYQAVAESFPDIFGDAYVYIRINDYDVIEHQNFKQTFFPVFAKILLPFNTKNTLINDIDLQNVVQREYNFLQPVNIQRLTITIYDAYGNIVDMKGANYSFTLQIEEVLNPALYEKLRDI